MSVSAVIVSFILIFINACAHQQANWLGTIEEVDGVTIVKNPKEPIYGNDIYIIEEELTIGEKQGDEEYVFVHMRDIEVDDSGNIYILDFKEAHIKVFDRNGDYLRTIGKKGQGPGELGAVWSIHINIKEELIVPDSRNGRINYFSLNGELLRSTKIEKNISLVNLSPKIDSQENYYALILFYDKPIIELQKFSPGLEYLHTVTSFPKIISKRKVLTPYPPIALFTISNDDTIICGRGDKYEIDIFSPKGRLTRKILNESGPVRIPDDVIRKETEIAEQRGGIYSQYKIEFPKYYPFFYAIASDEEGRLYVGSYEQRGDIGTYDVHSAEGKYLTWIPIKGFIEKFKRNKIYTIHWDEDGYQYLKRYKVTWNY